MNISKTIDSAVKKALGKLGLQIHRIKSNSASRQIALALQKFETNWIFDVGANQGQFALEMRAAGYAGNIISFEPLAEAHAALVKASTTDSNWHVHSRCALGDHNGTIELNVAGNSVSSSILPMLESHQKAAPDSIYQRKEAAPIYTLDSIAHNYLTEAHAPLLKIDTQGFEWQVLQGATQVLPHFQCVLLELSLVPLYEGQLLWRELIDWLEANGFVLWTLQPMFVDPSTNRTLQVDGFFCRAS